MAASLFKLVGSIFIDNEDANKSIAKTDKKASALTDTFMRGAKTAAGFAASITAVASAAVTGLVKMASDTADSLDIIDKQSQQMDLTTEEYQEWAHALDMSGASIDDLQTGVKKLVSQIDGLQSGASGSAEAFDRLGVSIYDDNGNLKTQSEILNEVIYALADMESTADRTALVVDMFGKSGMNLLPMLNEGSEGIRDMKQEAHDLGLVISEDAIKQGAALNDMMSNTKAMLSTMANSLGTALMPTVMGLLEYVQGAMPTIKSMFGRLAPVLTGLLDQLLPPLLDLADTLLPVIMDVVGDLVPPLAEIVGALLPIIVDLVKSLLPILKPLLNLISPILEVVSALLKPLTDLLHDVLSVIGTVLNSLVEVVKGTFAKLIQFVRDPVNTILGFINRMIAGVTGGINTVIRALNGLSFSIPDWVPGLGGKNFGFDLRELTAPQIPLLANGAVIPPNKPYMAMVGDQTNGTNIEAPLDTIKQAVAETLAEMTLNVTVNASPDTAKWFSAMQVEAKSYMKRTGQLAY